MAQSPATRRRSGGSRQRPGFTWTHLASVGPAPYVYQNFSQDITGFASPTTQVRFVIESREDDKILLDNVQIEFTTPSRRRFGHLEPKAGSNGSRRRTPSTAPPSVRRPDHRRTSGTSGRSSPAPNLPTRDEKIVIGVADDGGPGPGNGQPDRADVERHHRQLDGLQRSTISPPTSTTSVGAST